MITYRVSGIEEIGKIDINAFMAGEMKSIANIIRDDITKNLTDERVLTQEIEGDYAKPKALSDLYLKFKRRKGYPPNIFRQKERLIKSVRSKKINDYHYQIYIGGDANNYAEYVNKQRLFMGVSKSIIEQIKKDFASKKIV